MIEMTLLIMATKNCFTQNKNLQYIIMGRKYDDRALFKIVFIRSNEIMVFESQRFGLKCVRNLDRMLQFPLQESSTGIFGSEILRKNTRF